MADLNRKDYLNCLGLLKYWEQHNPRAQNNPDLQRYEKIFTLWLEGKKSYSQIGREFSVSKQRVVEIISRTAGMLLEIFNSCKIKFTLEE